MLETGKGGAFERASGLRSFNPHHAAGTDTVVAQPAVNFGFLAIRASLARGDPTITGHHDRPPSSGRVSPTWPSSQSRKLPSFHARSE